MRASVAIVVAMVAIGCGGGGDGDDMTQVDAPPDNVPGRYTITGIARYEDREPLDDGGLAAPGTQLARGVQIAIVDDGDKMIKAMGVTGDDGGFSLSFDGVSGKPIHLLVVAASEDPMRPIEVVRTNGMTHGFGGPPFATGNVTQDVLVTIDSREAGAFNVFDQAVNAMDRARAVYQVPIVPLTLIWQIGSTDGTFYDGTAIHLLGSADDDDGFDDAVILHEIGHYIEDKYGRTDSPGGFHDGSPTDPRLAWSEGFSTYFSMAVRNKPVYADSNAGGGFGFNGDTSKTKAVANQPIGQNVSEDMVVEILWDIGDAPTSDDDGQAGAHDAVLDIQKHLKTATLRAVGKAGVDLVDALDGWFIVNGLASCTGVRPILDVDHTFPYDYGSSAGRCP